MCNGSPLPSPTWQVLSRCLWMDGCECEETAKPSVNHPLDKNNVGFSRIPHLLRKRRRDNSEMGHGGRRQGRRKTRGSGTPPRCWAGEGGSCRAGSTGSSPGRSGGLSQTEGLLPWATEETLSHSQGALWWPFEAKAERSEDNSAFSSEPSVPVKRKGGTRGLRVRTFVPTGPLTHQVAWATSASVSSFDNRESVK